MSENSNNQIALPLPCVGAFSGASTIESLTSQFEDVRIQAASALVQTCPQICPSIYGNGNPDISGIGVQIAFLLQTGYLILFVALFNFLYLFLPKRLITSLCFIRLRGITRAVLGTSTFLTFTSLVAMQVRASQNPPEYEVIFLQKLKMYLCETSRFSLMFYFVLRLRSIKVEGRDKSVLFFDSINFALSSIILPAIESHDPGNAATAALSDACSTLLDFPAITKGSSGVKGSSISWTVALVITGFASLGLGVLAAKWELTLRIAPDRRFLRATGRALLTILFAASSVLSTTSILHYALSMVKTRKRMMVVNQAAAGDNEWGFGQVTAVMLWLPLNILIALSLLRSLPWISIMVRTSSSVVRIKSGKYSEKLYATFCILLFAGFLSAYDLIPRDTEEEAWHKESDSRDEKPKRLDEESAVESSNASQSPTSQEGASIAASQSTTTLSNTSVVTSQARSVVLKPKPISPSKTHQTVKRRRSL